MGEVQKVTFIQLFGIDEGHGTKNLNEKTTLKVVFLFHNRIDINLKWRLVGNFEWRHFVRQDVHGFRPEPTNWLCSALGYTLFSSMLWLDDSHYFVDAD